MSSPARPSLAAIRKLVIVGRDEALWLAANVFLTAFHRTGLEIVAVELPATRRGAEAFATLRNQQSIHRLLALKETPLLAVTQGTYTLGQRFAGFDPARPPFIHGYGSDGRAINRVPFHHYWVKARAGGLKAEYDDFSLNAVAARQGRFFRPDAETDAFAECDYAYHLNAVPYIALLKQLAVTRGAVHLEAPALGEVARDAETGHITSVGLSNGQVVGGDVFIDATGPDSLLLGQALGVGFQSWQQWFPCDRTLSVSGAPLSPLPTFSQVSAFRSGCAGQFPLRNRTAVQLVYAGAELGDAQALQAATQVTSMRVATDAVITPFTAGRREAPWSGNCIGIGAAAAVFDPIDSIGIQTIVTGLSHLTSLLPLDGHMALERKEYNLNVAAAYERIRDYQICHYKLNRRVGEPLWDRCRDMRVPDALAYKIELFQARGHLVEYDDETFLDYDWRTMLLGHGLIPHDYDPVADQTPDAEVIQRFQHALGFIKSRVLAMKPMEPFLAEA